jgi:uncharacterized integral membrane protein
MSKKQNKTKSKPNYPIGKQQAKTETNDKIEFYRKHKSTIWTVIIIIILAIFFIVNNTRKVPEHGPYPPNYQGSESSGYESNY